MITNESALKVKAFDGAITMHQRWLDGEISNLGGFQTLLFKAFTEADEGNKARLRAAFPCWFLARTEKVN